MEMKAGGYLTDGTELHDTNFARIAEACGITGIRVEKASEVDEALQRAFSIDGPVLVDVVVASEELAIPPQARVGWQYRVILLTQRFRHFFMKCDDSLLGFLYLPFGFCAKFF